MKNPLVITEEVILNWRLEEKSIKQLKRIIADTKITLKIYLAYTLLTDKLLEERKKMN